MLDNNGLLDSETYVKKTKALSLHMFFVLDVGQRISRTARRNKNDEKFRGVYKVIEKEYNLLVKIFEKYYDSYEEMLCRVKDLENDTVIWSDSFLEFFPYQNALSQLKKPKIYKAEQIDTLSLMFHYYVPLSPSIKGYFLCSQLHQFQHH